MTTESIPAPVSTESPLIEWNSVFEEGEKRIQARFLDAMLTTTPRDRARLLALRDHVKRKIADALEQHSTRKMKHALREQVRLLAKLGYVPAESL